MASLIPIRPCRKRWTYFDVWSSSHLTTIRVYVLYCGYLPKPHPGYKNLKIRLMPWLRRYACSRQHYLFTIYLHGMSLMSHFCAECFCDNDNLMMGWESTGSNGRELLTTNHQNSFIIYMYIVIYRYLLNNTQPNTILQASMVHGALFK